MSADNWRVCPKCKKRLLAEHEEKVRTVAATYGKVPSEEYMRAFNEVRNPPELETELREDYDIGTTEDGEFYVGYSCHCKVCGFEHSFKHEQKLEV